MVIELNTDSNHSVVRLEPIKRPIPSNGVSPNQGIPQERSAAILDSLIEERTERFWVLKLGVIENKGSTK